MSVIHFVGGEKGGVGKSVVARLLSQFFLDQSQYYVGLDADQSHATLTRYYREFTRPLNLDHFETTDAIMELALERDQQVLVDLPAQSQRFLDRWLEENDVLTMCAEMSIPLLYWYVVDDGPDSAQLLADFLARYRGKLQTIVVKNLGCGSDFSQIEAMPSLAMHRSANGSGDLIRQIALPALHAATMSKINKLHLSYWAAVNVKDPKLPHLSIMERQRSKVWLRKCFEAMEAAIPKAEA